MERRRWTRSAADGDGMRGVQATRALALTRSGAWRSPEPRVVRRELRADGAHVGMAARLDVRLTSEGIGEVDAPGHAAHDRSRIGRVLEPDRVAELVGRDLVEQRLARGLAAGGGLVHHDADGQGDHATLVYPE